MADTDIPFLSTLRKPETQTLGVSNLKIFHTIIIYKMVAIFLFFHNGWHWYSISIDTWKTRDPSFGGGVSNLKFFYTIDIYEMATIFQFFHNGWCWYSVSQLQIFLWFSFPSPHHFIFVSVSTFKYDDVPMLKMFMCGHSPPPQVQFHHLCLAMVETFVCGHLCVMTFLYFMPRKIRQNRLTHLCVAVVNRLGDSDESPKNKR